MTPGQAVEELVWRFGSIAAAGRAYDDRYGYKKNGERLFLRIRNGRDITMRTWDRIETMLRG